MLQRILGRSSGKDSAIGANENAAAFMDKASDGDNDATGGEKSSMLQRILGSSRRKAKTRSGVEAAVLQRDETSDEVASFMQTGVTTSAARRGVTLSTGRRVHDEM